MNVSITTRAGPSAAIPTRSTAPTGLFARSLAQVAGAQVAGGDADVPPPGDAKSKDDGDKRQDDSADGNVLPVASQVAPDPGLLALTMQPPIAPPTVDVSLDATPLTTRSIAPTPTAVGATAAAAMIAAAATAPPGDPAPASTTVLPTDADASATPTVPDSPTPSISQPQAATSTDAAARVPPCAVVTPLPMIATPAPGPDMPTAVSAPIAPIPPVSIPAPATGPDVPAIASTSIAPMPLPQSVPGLSQPPAVSVAAFPATPIVAVATPVPTTAVVPDQTAPAIVTTVTTPNPTPATGTIQIDARSAPIVTLAPAAAPSAVLPGNVAATTSAIQAFGAAMRAGMAKDPQLDSATNTTNTLSTAALARTDQMPAVAATGDAQQAPLDLRREQWPHAMIDRIEALRDAADASSTKIRVVPDALGPVEMSVRKDGDTLHVHFTADQAATRAILTDAQPRLAAIAEQRGLRLGGSTVDGGSTGAGQQQQNPARQPSAPAPFSTTVTAAIADDDDTRIA